MPAAVAPDDPRWSYCGTRFDDKELLWLHLRPEYYPGLSVLLTGHSFTSAVRRCKAIQRTAGGDSETDLSVNDPYVGHLANFHTFLLGRGQKPCQYNVIVRGSVVFERVELSHDSERRRRWLSDPGEGVTLSERALAREVQKVDVQKRWLDSQKGE